MRISHGLSRLPQRGVKVHASNIPITITSALNEFIMESSRSSSSNRLVVKQSVEFKVTSTVDSTAPPTHTESSKEEMQNEPNDAVPDQTPDFKRGFRFWCIIAGLSVTSLQSSLENSVVVTAGPAIVNDLQMGESYIWITNAFFLCW